MEEEKVFEVTGFYVLSQFRYLILVVVLAVVGLSILYSTYVTGLDSLRGFAYPTKRLDELLQISSSTYPLNASIDYNLIINRRSIYNYTLFCTIIDWEIKGFIARITYSSLIYLHLASVFLTTFTLAPILSSEIVYVLRSYCRNKISYAIALGITVVIIVIPLSISLFIGIIVLCYWIHDINYMEMLATLIMASLFPSIISLMLLLLTRISEIAYIYGFIPPLMALIDSGRAQYYMPILYIPMQNNWFYALAPYAVTLVLLLLLYLMKGGVR